MKSGSHLRSTVIALIFSTLYLSAPLAQARLKFKHRWETSGSLLYRQLNQKGFSELEDQTDGLFVLALEQTATYNKWSFEIRPELRALSSPALETNPQDLSRIPLVDQTRAMDFHYQMSPAEDEEASSQTVTDIEKLNIRFQGSQLEFIAGRNPFNPSIMRLSPIWNKFGKDIFYVGYPNFQFNPDISSLKWQSSNFWIQNANVFGKEPEQTAYLFLAGTSFDSIEVQLLAGNWWKQMAFGGNLSLTTEESLWKAELLHIEAESETLPSHTQAALGFERSWTESFSTVSEAIISNLPDQYPDPKQITLGASPFLKLRSKLYLATQFDYQITDFWLGSLTPVMNLEDSSSILALSLKGNLSDNLEITGTARFGIGSEDSEFSSNSVQFLNGSYLGYNDIASVLMKYFFQ